MSSHYPPIHCLQVHLENMQQVVYMEGLEEEALHAASVKETHLTAYFKTVTDELAHPLQPIQIGTDPDGNTYPGAKDLTYREFPRYYTSELKTNIWKRRKRPHKAPMIGRIYTVHPNEGEQFYLRLLLVNKKSVQSFHDIKIFKKYNIQLRTTRK